jgi:hypothetical protein
MSTGKEPLGKLLKITPHMDGTHTVILDNGPVSTLTIVTLSADLAELLGTDLSTVRDHLMTRRPNHFRVKP